MTTTGYTFSCILGIAFWRDSIQSEDYLLVIETSSDYVTSKIVKVKISDGSCIVLKTLTQVVSRMNSISVNTSGNIYVFDGQLLVLDSTGTQQKAFGGGELSGSGLVVDSSGAYAYMSDTDNNLVRKIDLNLGTVSTIGTKTDVPFNKPCAIALVETTNGFVYVADADNHISLVYISPLNKVYRLYSTPSLISFTLDGTAFTIDPQGNGKLYHFRGQIDTKNAVEWTAPFSSFIVFDTDEGGCKNTFIPCYIVIRSTFNQESGKSYIACDMYYNGATEKNYIHFFTLDTKNRIVLSKQQVVTSEPQPSLPMESIQTATGDILYTSAGAYDLSSNYNLDNQFTELIGSAMAGTNYKLLSFTTKVMDISKIPALPGKTPQFLLVLLDIEGLTYSAIYDSATDTYNRNLIAGARTHVMLAYSWGVCGDTTTKGLVEITYSNDYSNECQLPKKGLYYQSENKYFAIPFSCLSIAYDKLLTDCAEIKANMRSLVDRTCAASIVKMCTTQYTSNPPFLCTSNSPPSVLSVISLSASNSMAISSFLATVVAALLARLHKNYKATPEELEAVNPHMDDDVDDVDDDPDRVGSFGKSTSTSKKQDSLVYDDGGDVELRLQVSSASIRSEHDGLASASSSRLNPATATASSTASASTMNTASATALTTASTTATASDADVGSTRRGNATTEGCVHTPADGGIFDSAGGVLLSPVTGLLSMLASSLSSNEMSHKKTNQSKVVR